MSSIKIAGAVSVSEKAIKEKQFTYEQLMEMGLKSQKYQHRQKIGREEIDKDLRKHGFKPVKKRRSQSKKSQRNSRD